jgi:GNAT superfamily N-acetyltransferase
MPGFESYQYDEVLADLLKAASPQVPEFEWEVRSTPNTGRGMYGGFEILALDEGKEVGGTYVGVDYWQQGTGYATVRSSNLKPVYRNRGFGRILYDKTIEEAKRRGFTRLYADTDQSEDARRMWESIAKRHPLKQDETDPQYRYVDLTK